MARGDTRKRPAGQGPGHVFVVRGKLHQLIADDLLISTDRAGVVEPTWDEALGWTGGQRPPPGEAPVFRRRKRVFRVPDRSTDFPRRWFVLVGADRGESVDWLRAGVREALTSAAQAGRRRPSRGVRQRIAMPVMGVGRGGFDSQRGAVIDGLLEEAKAVADEYGVDVVLVAFKSSDYSALQAVRRRRHEVRLPDEQEEAAGELAQHARSGRLALFMGAGTGVPAGLPSWGDLLTWLAERTNLPDGDGLDRLNPLDAAEVLRRAVLKEVGRGRANALGALVAERIGRPSRYALSHILLAALRCEQAITTNFDRLYETAVSAIEGEPPPVVLPDSAAAGLREADTSAGWLLKLHGDVDDPASIVLDRRSFVRYDSTRRPLGGVLQTTLLTKHLLVVGASMTDDNVIRLVHEVSSLHEKGGREPRRLGTVLTLTHDPLRHSLWAPEFTHVELGTDHEHLPESGRALEILLDRVALLAAPTHSHLLDPRYRELLATPVERSLAEDLADVVGRLEQSRAADDSWGRLAEALRAFGAPVLARPSSTADSTSSAGTSHEAAARQRRPAWPRR